MSVFKTGKMIYRNFGNSGLRLSVISFGNMLNYKPENAQLDQKIFKLAFENGINYIDTAQIYGLGESQVTLGKILKNLQVERESLVIATKVHTAVNPDRNSSSSTNRKHVRQSIKKSLDRLQLEYVDILYAHLYDVNTPLEEICRAFHEVIEDGLAFYWATSNWDAQHVFEAIGICERLNLHKPIGAQNQYSMLHRTQIQSEYESLLVKYGYGLVGWSPLAGGFLTGRHLAGIKEDQLSRLTEKGHFGELIKKLYYDPYANEKTIGALLELEKVAQELGIKLLHLALLWAIKFPYLTSALTGARTVEQLEEILSTLDLLDKFTPEVERRVNKILNNAPAARHQFREWKAYPPLRPVDA